ncbi:MAG: hypothetical protein HYY16_06795 [Planctomycetes bacterium]|nr:hypothetical protein [Planctomycetota bacterium]
MKRVVFAVTAFIPVACLQQTPAATCEELETLTKDLVPPLAPGRDAWYERLDDPLTDLNEAADDIARVVDPARGALYRHTYDEIRSGRRVVIFVAGTGSEARPAGWGPSVRDWMRELGKEDTGCAVVPIIQVNYLLNTPLLSLADQWLNSGLYWLSYLRGLDRAKKLVLKAASAGSSDIWIFGHSKGGDIVGNAVGHLSGEPSLTAGCAFGVPYVDGVVRSSVAPSWVDPTRRGGLFKYDVHDGRAFQGKLIVFNRYSDWWSNNFEPWRYLDFGGPGHDYTRVWADARFRQRVLDMMNDPALSIEDRQAGIEFDF